MRPLELTLALAVLLSIILLFTVPRLASGLSAIVLSFSILVVCVHAFVEGLHWQLVPLYACIPLLALAFRYSSAMSQWLFRSCAIASVSLLTAAMAFSYVLPMFKLPDPTGRYKVGTRLVYLVDSSRREIHGPFPRGNRELMVQIWYPTERPNGPLARYRRRSETTLLSSYMSVLRTHSYADAPIAKSGPPFPVLLFNPAWKNPRTQNTFQFEDLASHGFVVASIDHTYNSQPVAFPDGRRITSKDLPEIGDFSKLTWQEFTNLGDQELAYQTADDRFVLDSLSRLNLDSASDYFGRLNADDAGAFGHSFGGAVAMEICRSDSRVRAALNMDGWFFGDVAKDGLDKPLFMMSDDSPAPPEEDLRSPNVARRLRAEWMRQDIQRADYTLEKFGGWSLVVRDSRHMIFSDRALYSPIRSLRESGPVDSRAAHHIIESYTLEFFSKYLRGEASRLLGETPSRFPGAELKIYFRPGA
jgi:predicted dienelactone hydrolase